MSSSASNAPSGAGSNAPAIRTFQMDSGGIGNLSSSVNLFRGDVNLNQTLFSLPGRSPDNGLDVNMTIQYQSNVHEQAHTWNRDAPTGVIGLGWNFPLTWIEANAGGSPLASSRQYTLYDNGSPNPLIRQSQAPVVLRLPAAAAAGLVAGQPVPNAVLDGIRGMGLALDASALVEGSGPWLLADAVGLQLYALAVESGSLCVRDGGEYYQLQSYQFWRVVYYPRYERWVVVSDAAVRRSFGAQPGQGAAQNAAIAWQVWWTDASGNRQWTGASTRTESQQQVATGWYLNSVQDRFGNQVQYRYATVQQAVGEGGLSYTKAVYLDSITDSFGRQVRCHYGDKLWSAGDSEPREYADPHRSVPSNDPSAWQDRYETRYLNQIDVLAANDERLFSVLLEYAPRPEVSGPQRQVANVTRNSGALLGDTYKRFLTGIRMVDGSGLSQPGLEFSYFLQPETARGVNNAPGPSPGALAGILYPEGGTASYAYQLNDLSVCERSLTVPRPAEVTAGASPRVYFGPDYAVVCYYNASAEQLTMQVCTWAGSWITWQLDPASALLDTQGLDLSTLQVLADADVMVLHFARTAPSEQVAYVFQRDTTRMGHWLPGTLKGVTTARNTPPLHYSNVGVDLSFLGGASYFLVSQMIPGSSSGVIDRYTWRWPRRQWSAESLSTSGYSWIGAGADAYAVLDAQQQLSLHTLDADLLWQDSAALTVNGLIVNAPSDVVLTMGDGLLAVSNLQASNSQSNTYQLWIAQWNAARVLALSSFGPYTDEFGLGNPATPWQAQVVAGGLVAVNSHLLRFDGVQWLSNNNLDPGALPGGRVPRYAFGPDYAVQIIVPTTGVGAAEARVLGFDPLRDRQQWTAQPVVPAATLPPQNSPLDNWPSAGGEDYAVLGPWLYFRGSSGDWGSVVSAPALADLGAISNSIGSAQFDSRSLVDSAPTFLAWTAIDGSTSAHAEAILLSNGAVFDVPVEFADQRIVTPGEDGISGPGVSPAGPDVFVSFPANATSFDTAPQITLHRHTANALRGPIRHYAVATLVIDDGYQEPMASAYLPDGSTAGCSTDGRVVKYFLTSVHPGTTDPTAQPYGRALSRYLNGIVDTSGDNARNMLDGMLLSTENYDKDNVLKSSTQTTWKVYTEVATDPLQPSAATTPLYGGFVAALRQVSFSDGVNTVMESAFVDPAYGAPYSSGALRQFSSNFSGNGTAEVFTREQGFGITVVPGLRAIQAYGDAAEQRSWRTAAGVDTLVQAVASSYQAWASRIGAGVSTWATEASFGLLDAADTQFPYASYQPGQTPAGWVPAARTTARTADGQEAQSLDPLGVPTATVFSTDLRFAVARIANATLQGAAFLGFQEYEDATPFHPSGLRYDSEQARMGTRSAVLPAGGAGSLQVEVQAQAAGGEAVQDYVVGCWYRSAPGYAAASGSGWTVQVWIDGIAQPPLEVRFADTQGAWSYRSIGVPISATAGQHLRISLRVGNTGSGDIWLNALLLAPLVNGLIARWFDVPSQQFTASMDAGGRTSRTCYDQAWQPTLSVGASGQVRELSQRFQSRRGSADGGFDPASPNAELTLHPAAGGVVESFRDGGDWRSRWTATPAADWSAAGGQLVHGSVAQGTLQWTGQVGGASKAAYFELAPSGPGAQVQLSWGGFVVSWTGAGYSATLAGRSLPALGGTRSLARHWLMVIGEGVLLFFADGQLLYSTRGSSTGDPLRLSSSGAPLTLRHLSVLGDVRIGLSWNDGATRQRQVQQLHGADSRINEIVFDQLGRQVATTRVAPGSFGSGASLAPLQYSPGFLDVRAFVAALSGSWEMHGDVADYYRGQVEDGVARSNDEGYPYRGVRYEASPRNQQVETSRPGKAYAINLTVPAEQRMTLQYTYTSNGSGGPLPADGYFLNQLRSPLKTVSGQLDDQMGMQVGTQFLDAQGALLSSTDGLRDYRRDAGGPSTLLTTRLPNATTTGPQSGNAGYVQTQSADGLQRPLEAGDPDTGLTAFINDNGGQTRFVRPAQESGEAWLVYYKYDPLGRMLEQGVVDEAFDRARLSALANQPDWPQHGQAAIRTVYDGDGNVPEQIGKKIQAQTFNRAPDGDPDAGDVTVTETFGYDSAGQMIEVRQQTSGAVASDARLGYAYNALAEIVRMDLPSAAPLASVHYHYNDQGWIDAVGSTQGGAELGAYSYAADGDVQKEILGAGAWTQRMAYASPGWVLSMSTTKGGGGTAQQLDFNYSYAADGSVQDRSVVYNFPGSQQTLADQFGYDGQRRLLSATGSLSELITQYDPNGNIWAAQVDGDVQSFPTEPGSDRVATATLGGNTSTLLWNPRGQLLSGLDRTLEYDRTTSMTTRVTHVGNALRLAYGSSQQRVYKQVRSGAGSAQVYLNGASQVPVAVLRDGAWSVLVQGPLGLLAVVGAQTLYPLKDMSRSTWALVDANGLRGRWTYRPFGQLVEVDDAQAAGFSALYQGQEWDVQTGLYNFKARLYDPQLRRFLGPDPARQFASLYMFAGDNPLVATDPTGEISIWAQVGIGAALVIITAVGFGLTLFTAGGSAAAAGAADAALLGVAEGAVVGAEVGAGAASAAGAAGAAGAAAAEGGAAAAAVAAEGAVVAGAAGAAEVGAGAAVAEAATATATWGSTLTTLAVNTLGSSIMGAGISGLEYDINHGRDFTAKGFFEAMGIGAVSGLISGGLGGAGALGVKGLTAGIEGGLGVAARMGGMALVKGVVGVLSTDVSTILTNVAAHQPWYQGLAEASVKAGIKGVASGAGGSLFKDAWSNKVNLARMAGVTDQSINRISSMVDRVQTAATSTDAYMIYGSAAFFVVSGYAIWGATTNFKV